MLVEDIKASGWRLGLLSLLVFAAMATLLSRLWNVQVVNTQSAQARSEEQTTLKMRKGPARGVICDRNGVPLAENRPSFDIDFYLDKLLRDYKQAHKGNYPKINLKDGPDGRKRSEPDIVEIVKESIQPISQTLGLSAPLNEKEIREHYRTDRDLPYHYMTDLDFATVAQFEERNSGVPGIRIAQNPARIYDYGAFAAHILGYVGKPVNQTEHLADDGTPFETIGRHGIEAVMDDHLQGEPGSEIWRVSSQGYYQGDHPIQENDPTMGDTIYLTIDARMQYIAETAMRNAGVGRGAAVIIDPRNGDVLAMVSIPSYDPNKFIPKISAKDWDALNQDPTAPLYNRALHALPPGSTYKIMVALAGLKSGKVSVDTTFDCPAAIQIGDHLFHNSDHSDGGTMSLVNAIRVSSDVFFYQYGIRAGIEAIDEMGARAGFGHKWGLLDADEDAGKLPGPEWMKQNEAWLRKTHNIDRWSNAQTANTAIGQGFVLCTPLQLATFLCAVANGGTVYHPRLYSKVVDYNGDTGGNEFPEAQVYSTLDVRPSDLQAVRQGMLEVVQNGTGTQAQVKGFDIAGKTGTAQAYKKIDGSMREDIKGWFYCFGPFQSPRYVVCVMAEGVQWGGTSSAPIAGEIMRRLFDLETGSVEQAKFLQPAAGNFNGITAVQTYNPDAGASSTGNSSSATPGDASNTDSSNGDNPNSDVSNRENSTADVPPPVSARASGSKR